MDTTLMAGQSKPGYFGYKMVWYLVTEESNGDIDTTFAIKKSSIFEFLTPFTQIHAVSILAIPIQCHAHIDWSTPR